MLVRPEVIQDPYSNSGPLHAKLQSNFRAPAFPHPDRTHYCDTFKLLLCLYKIWQLRVDTLHPASLLPGAGILCRMHIYPYPTYSIYMNAPFIVSPPISEVSIEPEDAPQGLAVSCRFIFTYTPCMPSEQID